MAPITLQRLIKQLDKLKPEADAARLRTHDYARWLARMIRRLRERSLDADRAAATVALAEALKRGAIPAPMKALPNIPTRSSAPREACGRNSRKR